MENKINVAELLKTCPAGMELDCTMYEGAELECVTNDKYYPIKIIIKDDIDGNIEISLTKEGYYNVYHNPKCVIFPKGKTTWEGFQRPFKDGDILYCNANDDGDNDDRYKYVFILKEIIENKVIAHCFITGERFVPSNTFLVENSYPIRFATEEEKQKLFQAIKEHGYKWNAESKCLEKLIQPKFKVGDKIRHKSYTKRENIVTEIKDTRYILDDELALPFISQDDYELVPTKFDITTLIPFESKVLIRDHKSQKWRPAIWGVYDPEPYFPYKLIGCISRCCIPYEGNEHLLNTTDDCCEYYKTWE